MVSARPLRIGISACFFHADPIRPVFKGKTLQYLEQSMVRWITSTITSTTPQGAHAYLIPSLAPDSPVKVSAMVEDFDGLVLQGGSDLAPQSYGETPLKPEWAGDYIRDVYEIELVHAFLKAGKPILGICRGAQLLNVALGGTMVQDIEMQVPGARVHRNWDQYDQIFHEIKIEENSGLAKIFRKPAGFTAKINTVHHQGLARLGRDLIVEARCTEDQVIEAIRYTGNSYAFGVQWHPEFQDPSDTTQLSTKPILEDFLTAARSLATT